MVSCDPDALLAQDAGLQECVRAMRRSRLLFRYSAARGLGARPGLLGTAQRIQPASGI